MNNISANKLFSHLDRVVNDKCPITADIFLTNYCNNRCPYCTYRRWELEPGARAIKYEDFIVYAKRLIQLGVLGFILTGGGEPTINPDFEKITGWLEENKIRYGINTNFNKLKLFKPEYLKVSLDGHDKGSYMLNRGVDAYEHVISNIIDYIEWKKKNSPKTSLGIQCIPHSKEDVISFYEAHKGIDVDYMVFRPIESTNGDYYKTKDNVSEANEVSDTVKSISKFDHRCVLNFKFGMLGMREKDCTAQWAQIAMNESGDIMYCCHKPYEIVGHVLDDDILEKKEKFKTNMSMCDVPCRMTSSNSLIATIEKGSKNEVFI